MGYWYAMPDAVEDTAVGAAGGGGCCEVGQPPGIIAAALREVLGGETMRFDDDCNCGR